LADNTRITVTTTPRDLYARMERFPNQLGREIERTMKESLAHVHGSVPAYPPARPGSSYRRTGTLGRTLGSGQAGGAGSKPDILEVKRVGGGGFNYEGRFGTRLFYAPHVIGAQTQRPVFKRLGWWTMADVAERAQAGVQRLFDLMAERMRGFLEGR
jgi:hypothetical protein